MAKPTLLRCGGPCVLALLAWTMGARAEVQVLYGDCADVLDDAQCAVRDDDGITLWVRPNTGERVQIRDQARELASELLGQIDGGTRYSVAPHTDSRQVHVVAETATDKPLWSLQLTDLPPAPQLAKVRSLFGQRRYDECEALLTTLVGDADYARHGSALRLAGIFYHNRGQPERARDFYARAIDALIAEGRTLEAVRAASALSYLSQHTLRDFGAARAALARFAPAPSWPAEARYFVAYDRALLAFNSGDPRAALAAFDDAARIARRMGATGTWLRRRVDAEELLASQLQRIGRREDARALFAALQAQDLTTLGACERAQFASNHAWSELLILEAGDAAPDPSAALSALVPTMREHCSVSDQVSLHIHRALAHWHAGRHDAAQSALADAQAATDRPELRLRFWELDIAARIAAARGDVARALATLEQMETLADATLSPDALWRATARRGEVLEMAGRVDAALAAYARADEVLVEDLSRVPFWTGKGPFNASRDWVTRRRLALLVDARETEAAAALVRTASLRATLAAAAQRPAEDAALTELSAMRLAITEQIGAGWRVPANELAVLRAQRAERERSLSRALDNTLANRTRRDADPVFVAPGDAQLALYPLVRQWLLVVWTSDGPHTVTVDCDERTPNALAQCALTRAAPLLSDTQRLIVLDGNRLAQADVAALRIDDRPVLATHRVLYSAGEFSDQAWSRPQGPLAVVGDPTRQLPRSRAEALAVADAGRRATGGAVTLLTGRAATFEAVRAQLDTADVWHFAGHAETAGLQRWQHALALASGETLSVSDVLALPRSPRVVVLSACATSGADAMHDDGATGLAQAFLVAGAQAVIATSRAVSDDHAQQMMAEFYSRWRAGAPADAALADAQRIFAQRDGDVDWSAFRLLVR